jgi:uncharacterized membrane protein YfcA
MPGGAGTYFWLGLASLAAGGVNSIAGGGTLLTFPALLAAVAPVTANGTSTTALVPGSLAGAWGFRRELAGVRRWAVLLVPPSLAGGLAGSLLVTRLDPHYFSALVPWLILAAALLFLFQPVLTRRREKSHPAGGRPRNAALCVALQFVVAVYGGYFGAGIGILMLSVLGLMDLGDIHAMNGLKNLLAACINGVSVAVFVADGAVAWRFVPVMAVAAIAGAYGASHVSRLVDRRVVRWAVIAIAFGLAGHYFYRQLNGGL